LRKVRRTAWPERVGAACLRSCVWPRRRDRIGSLAQRGTRAGVLRRGSSMSGLVQLRPPEVRFRWLDALWIQVTGTLCNIACRHCFISCGPKADQVPIMSAEAVERAVEEGRDLGMRQVYFTGGEPFLHPELR